MLDLRTEPFFWSRLGFCSSNAASFTTVLPSGENVTLHLGEKGMSIHTYI